ncbi:UDP-D-xylose:L-fucose alpha-1,3-D-xylosyltransferase 3-like, partial [Acanthaster planci]|uniref:UDP-D-xylose:L-fucose alpha-1,3-D-xylosyltransferase 3-like n=1 Tax=Acanthaster planci TaxID=133434 RepID=A0A8B7Z503_ACAPL
HDAEHASQHQKGRSLRQHHHHGGGRRGLPISVRDDQGRPSNPHGVQQLWRCQFRETDGILRALQKLVNRRHYYILSLLERGQEVLFIDADTFWFRDPFEYFHGNFDMSFVDERSPYPKRLPKRSLHCAGLGYFRPTNRTLRFVRKWISIIAEKKRPPSDQGVLNYMMHNDIPEHVNVRPLPLAFFPHALIYYKDNWNKNHNGTIIVHNVGLRGHDAKMNKFKANGMWLVNVTYNEIAQSFNQSTRH